VRVYHCSRCGGRRGPARLYCRACQMDGFTREVEPTAEQVEAMVAKGLANLPKWWQYEEARMGRGPG
jgi:hypothetical protein